MLDPRWAWDLAGAAETLTVVVAAMLQVRHFVSLIVTFYAS